MTVGGKQINPLFLDHQGRCLRKCKKGDWRDGTNTNSRIGGKDNVEQRTIYKQLRGVGYTS